MKIPLIRIGTDELDEIDLKFFGLFLVIIVIAVLTMLQQKEVVMALIAIAGAIVRDLYRSQTNKAKNHKG